MVHYVGNPGSTAEQNRNFYAGDQSNVSSHFVVGLKGEIIQCIPLSEMSAASNWRNNDTISIEVCHPDDTGKFNKKTYKSLVKLVAWLEDQCGLEDGDVIRHYDITGKECPRYLLLMRMRGRSLSRMWQIIERMNSNDYKDGCTF